MLNLAKACGALGVILFVLAVIGRFYQEPSITVMGYRFQSSTFLTLADTFLLFGIFLLLLAREKRA